LASRAAGKEKEKRVGGMGRKRGRGEREKGFSFFKLFSNSFSNFQTSIKQETMHSNHDA
jgi:hypothetical protein